ncbi:DNA repair protein complementing XP-A cells homolog [Mya arenaria]|nr:DNA repair protein complementing XP-A cells homolog [Mya arenaria]XP_052796368.1 DNA repair protein complementing XP-A cells homolog [Mya arenaria]
MSEEAGPSAREDAEALSAAQRARIERNRQRALLLRQARLQSHPYATDALGNRVKGPPREIDTGAGFFIEEEEEKKAQKINIVHLEGPFLEPDDQLLCSSCGKDFMDSYFLTKFDESVCDVCRQNEDKFPIITRTEAKKKYLLKDVDFDRREPELKFILRKNPHNQRWGDMKLYLECQVERRALEVWGSEEKMEEARQQRSDNKEKAKQKKFDKKVKDLRLAVRSSLLKKDRGKHEHEFGQEKYDEEEDEYSKTCTTCGYTMNYEKM